MSIYSMHTLNKEGTVFSAKSTFYTDEYAEQALSLYLRDQLVKDQNGRMKKQFRLHAHQPHSIEMALSYDIYCPDCGNRLKQIGRCRNSHELGLYTCPACDKR